MIHQLDDGISTGACPVTGEPAYARVLPGGLVVGRYGSTVADDADLVVLDGALPEGPIGDAALSAGLADGRVFDGDLVVRGVVPLDSVPDGVAIALLRSGIEGARRSASAEAPAGLHVPPVIHVEDDDPLTTLIAPALFGRPRGPGPDLRAIGALAYLARRARGREGIEPEAMARAVLDDIRSRMAEANAIYASLASA